MKIFQNDLDSLKEKKKVGYQATAKRLSQGKERGIKNPKSEQRGKQF